MAGELGPNGFIVSDEDTDPATSRELLFEAGHVYMETGPTPNEATRIRGSIAVFQDDSGDLFVTWRPTVNSLEHRAFIVDMRLSGIYAFKVKGTNHLYLIKKETGFLPPMYFALGSDKRLMFLMFLLSNGALEQSHKDKSIYVAKTAPKRATTTATAQSTNKVTPPVTSSSSPNATRRVVDSQPQIITSTAMKTTSVLQQQQSHDFDGIMKETHFDGNKIITSQSVPPHHSNSSTLFNVSATTSATPSLRDALMGSFATVTAKTREYLGNLRNNSNDREGTRSASSHSGSMHEMMTQYDNVEDHHDNDDASMEMNGKQSKYSEIKTDLKYRNAPVYELEECVRFNIVCNEEWNKHIDIEGHVIDNLHLRSRIFHGAVHDNIRPIVWKYLLNHRSETFSENESFLSHRRQLYDIMKTQWTSVTEKQLQRNHHLQEQISRISKDVPRTDRDHPLFINDNSPHLQQLNDILMTYGVYNHDLGYVQGMSDIAAVLVLIMNDEVDAFWCFVSIMDDYDFAANFHSNQQGVNDRLAMISILLRFIDPELMSFLDSKDLSHLLFCFRWLLVCFKREFSFEDIKVLWEVILSRHLTQHFEAFVATAILILYRDKIMQPHMEFDLLLQFINGLSMHIHLNTCLGKAESILNYLVDNFDTLPADLKSLLSLPSITA